MSFDISEWLNLGLRLLHVTTAIAWIGSSFYFVWLDYHLKPTKKGEASGELWSVHGGGFYHKQKYQVAPSQMPDDLHWFKWESYFTWISGFSLLILIYYVGAQNYLVDPTKMPMSSASAIAIGLASLVIGWVFYDLLCRSPLQSNNLLLGVIWFVFLITAAWYLNSIFNARGAYIHIGAMLGTVMTANVFLIIIPNQRKVVAALLDGKEPDPMLGKAAKMRSVHNNYMTLPVLFIMLSNHYPMTYGAQRPWLVLALLCITGVMIRHIFNLRHQGLSISRTIFIVVILLFISINYVSTEKAYVKLVAPSETKGISDNITQKTELGWDDVSPIFQKHCTSCHASKTIDQSFDIAPMGVKLDQFLTAQTAASRVKKVAVDSEIMPMGNPTGMTKDERDTIGRWIAAGAPQ